MSLARVWWALGVLLVVLAAVVCLIPIPKMPQTLDMSDKVGHLIGHGALALYFAGLVPRSRWWKIFVYLLLFGVVIEFAQFYMGVGRDGDPRDVLANALGAAVGLVLSRFGLHRWPAFVGWLFGRRAAQ